MIAHTPIRSVRTFFLWKLTAMTDLQIGHLILIMPSTASGSASNSLLFLFIFTTWTSHMHFLHIFSPPARGQPKGNVKLTVGDCFIFLCTVCRDLNPMVAINIVYRTYVLLSTNFAFTRKPWRSFIRLKFTSDLYTNFIYSAGNVPDDYSQLHPHPPFYEYRYEISVFSDFPPILL